mgnify:CR=1 FL=1
MSWENYGKWELDHIRPLSTFNLEDRSEFIKACNYKNIRPLWKEDNIKRNSRMREALKDKSPNKINWAEI